MLGFSLHLFDPSMQEADNVDRESQCFYPGTFCAARSVVITVTITHAGTPDRCLTIHNTNSTLGNEGEVERRDRIRKRGGLEGACDLLQFVLCDM